jgi:hypothetical protein
LENGDYELTIPMSPSTPVPFAAIEADVGSWIAALFQGPTSTTLLGASEMLTWPQWLQLWADANGVKARYRENSEEEMLAKADRVISEAVWEEFRFGLGAEKEKGSGSVVLPGDVSLFILSDIEVVIDLC